MAYVETERRSYRSEKSFEFRLNESSRMHKKYKNKICVIVEKAKGSYLKDIDKRKYLVPEDLTLGGLSIVIRKRMSLESHESLIFFIDGKHLFPIETPISTIYNMHSDPDGLLYITYSNENTFG